MKIKLFKAAPVSSDQIIDHYLKKNRPHFKTLKKIKKMKIFAQAVMSPDMGVIEAKQMAGIDLRVNAKQFMDNPLGRALLDQYLEKDYTPDVIKKKLAEFWNAKEVVLTKFGDVVEKPNYEIQDRTMTRILKMKKWVDKDDDVDVSKAPPTQVIFNVVGDVKVGNEKADIV